MNLLTDAWIPVTRQDQRLDLIAPAQLTECVNPIIELTAPRPDFRGALYQFLIGLLQTTFAPADADNWAELLHTPPSAEELNQYFYVFSDAFHLLNPKGPAFFQDFEVLDDEPKEINTLLIDAPGSQTLKNNLDHFVKRGMVEGLCASCTATALFTLQTNAPSGGAGHRVGLRGGGPLTSLLLPDNPEATLWQKLWLNVLSEEALVAKIDQATAAVFPWLGPTRVSRSDGIETQPADVHLLQAYWGMPRRIRLEAGTETGCCSLCGQHSAALIRHYRTKNYGTNYTGDWQHPLTPYRYDPKKMALPLSLKGQQGGLGFRHWLGLVWQDPGNSDQCAQVVRDYYDKILCNTDLDAARLWIFGYDMDNMKARCWYEQTMPFIALTEERDLFFQHVFDLINAARDVLKELRTQIKTAWFKRPKDVSGDLSAIDHSFWEATEACFYQQLPKLLVPEGEGRFMPMAVAAQWHAHIKQVALRLFDSWVLSDGDEAACIKRIVKARIDLKERLPKLKSVKILAEGLLTRIESTLL